MSAGLRGFTLIEMLVVIAIIALAASMIAFLPQQDRREAAVQAAAEELAATLRLTRALAIDKRCVMGVSFNLQNGAGSSGLQINNWSGQHWYRIIGPAAADYQNTEDQLKTWSYPTYPTPNGYARLGDFMMKVRGAWIGDRHKLKARAVRLLALDDQDNGLCLDLHTWTRFATTYPRPWCGYWDATARRLHPWGGYDHAIAGSGFGYEGRDGAIAGCVNPADRATLDGLGYRIFAAGEERPLINGEWLDYVLAFNPDGSAQEGRDTVVGAYGVRMNVLTTRYNSLFNSGTGANLGDLLAGKTALGMPMASFQRYTGSWSITLAPDLEQDTATYPTALAALRSLTPMYRVQVGPLGNVRVVRVATTPPPGLALDPTPYLAQPGTYYQDGVPTNADGTRRDVRPCDDFVLPGLPQAIWRTTP